MAKRSKRAKPKAHKKSSLIIKTPESVHVFPSLEDVARLVGIADISSAIRDENQFRRTDNVVRQLVNDGICYLNKWEHPVSQVCYYRVMFGDRSPLDVSGTLSAGGRLNIGGAQTTDKLTALGNMRAGLYTSFTMETALQEARLPPRAKYKVFELKLNNPNSLNVIDLDAAVVDLEKSLKTDELLSYSLSSTHMAAKWEYVKVPMISQVVGQWLRENSPKNVAGIMFKSRHTSDKNMFFFFDSTAEAEAFFSTTEIV